MTNLCRASLHALRSFAGPLTAAAAFATLFAAACSDDAGPTAASGGDGSDAQFVAAICNGAKKFDSDYHKLQDQVTGQNDFRKVIEAIAKPLAAFADAFDRAKPPTDLQRWHDDTAAQFKSDIEEFRRTGDFTKVSPDAILSPPADAKDRLNAVAAKNQDCKDAKFSFDK